MAGATAIAAGGSHSLTMHADGTVWGFGEPVSGQLGRDYVNLDFFTPGPVSGLQVPTMYPGGNRPLAVAAGTNHSLVLRSDGTVWAFGSNGYGQLGNNTVSGNPNPTPSIVVGLSGAGAISAGGTHSLVLRSDGTVWAFGSNTYGELGIPLNAGTSLGDGVARQIPTLTGIVAIAAGTFHSLALRSDGTVWAFGSNHWGQLGTPTGNGTAHPTRYRHECQGCRAFERSRPVGTTAWHCARTARCGHSARTARVNRLFHKGLRVKGIQGATGIFEMTWAANGRATFEYLDPVTEAEPHVVWRRVGTHSVFKQP